MDKTEQQAQINALKSKFKFRSKLEDAEIVWLGENECILCEHYRNGRSKIVTVQDFVTDVYLENGEVEKLVYGIRHTAFQTTSRIEQLTDLIIEQGKIDTLEFMYTNFIRVAMQEYFTHLPDKVKLLKMIEDGEVEAPASFIADGWKKNALACYTVLIKCLEEMEVPERVKFYEEKKEKLLNDDFKKKLGKPDTQKIDETRFWEIINKSKEHSDTVSEQLKMLGEVLEGFNGAGIRSFSRHYAKQMKLLYHWNVWALGYAAFGGCGDETFDEFRLWLILQGDPKLLEMAINETAKAALRVPSNLTLPAFIMQSLIDTAHLARTGKLAKPVQTTLRNVKGKEWEEDKLAEIYPELYAHYETKSFE